MKAMLALLLLALSSAQDWDEDELCEEEGGCEEEDDEGALFQMSAVVTKPGEPVPAASDAYDLDSALAGLDEEAGAPSGQ
eukprot:CAMPEP_0197649894 /NCGR_PEP_ID=MMETSP1338-20131121/30135_1 /TAXON_ID=43686 ORGANISM="Pelagodinium beii, Strain RCC1491" /NCGR_SAMPLE_ID=MMETSP1338 /ASSEMBLY_ACC=CAM_ASM_000754 /LENGTH=79 /DNA_ID=CAMNT_0043224183 /DNA_START=76 /DNA_END=315 /DNA_ORIENTATION=-